MTTSTVNEIKTNTEFEVGDLYTNGLIVMLCTGVTGRNTLNPSFAGVIVHRYPGCSDQDCYIGATKEVLGRNGVILYFRKFQGEVTLVSR